MPWEWITTVTVILCSLIVPVAIYLESLSNKIIPPPEEPGDPNQDLYDAIEQAAQDYKKKEQS